MKIIDYLAKCYIDYSILPTKKRIEINNEKLLLSVDKQGNKFLIVKISDTLTSDEMKFLELPFFKTFIGKILKNE